MVKVKRYRKETGRFVVVDDAGNRFIIIEHTMITTVHTGKEATAQTAGKPTYKLSTSEAVRWLSDTEFEVASSRLKLHKRS